jgi:hypothetical protein
MAAGAGPNIDAVIRAAAVEFGKFISVKEKSFVSDLVDGFTTKRATANAVTVLTDIQIKLKDYRYWTIIFQI